MTPPARPNRARQDDDAADSIVTPFAKLQVAAAKRLEAAKRSHAKQAVEEPEREPKANKKAAQKKPAPKKGAQKADAKKSEKKKGARKRERKLLTSSRPMEKPKRLLLQRSWAILIILQEPRPGLSTRARTGGRLWKKRGLRARRGKTS